VIDLVNIKREGNIMYNAMLPFLGPVWYTVDRFDSEGGWFSNDQVMFLTVSCVFGNKSSAAAEMGNRLAIIGMGRKVGAAVPLSGGGELGPH